MPQVSDDLGIDWRFVYMKEENAPPEINEVAAGVASASIPLERDGFLRSLLRHLSGTLQDVVGQEIGDEINQSYRKALSVSSLSPDQVAAVLVDLKRRIQGEFFIISRDEEKIVLGNRACPFGEKVVGRPALCMMTSNVFGSIASENLDYAKVSLEETIAEGHSGCRVVVYLKATEEAGNAEGREYFKTEPGSDS